MLNDHKNHLQITQAKKGGSIQYKILFLMILLGSLFALSASVYFVSSNKEMPKQTVNTKVANHYYISNNGVDRNDCKGGTQDAPWKTWSKAEQCVPPGSTVYFKAGAYSRAFSGKNQNKITFAGELNHPITIKPAPGDEGQVHFYRALEISGQYGVISGIDMDAQGSYTIAAIFEGLHITIENSKIHDSKVYDCVHIYKGSDHISLIGNEIYDCGYANSSYAGPGDAIDVTGGTNITYRGNHIHHAIRGLQIKGGSLNVSVENNRIHDVDVAIFGSSMGAGSGSTPQLGHPAMHNPSVRIMDRYQAKNVIISNNLIYNNGGFFLISAEGWVDYFIYNNTIFNHSGGVVFAIKAASWEFFDSTALAYCTTNNCSTCSQYPGSYDCVQIYLPSRYGKIKNNIIYAFDRILSVSSGSNTGLEIASNLYFAQSFHKDRYGTYILGGKKYSFAKFQALGYEATSLIADPQFANIEDTTIPDLQLKKDSPAIDQGVLLASVNQDFKGVPRPYGANYDIGAYEFTQTEANSITFLPIVLK